MRHLIIPDVQNRPGDDTQYLEAAGNYIVDLKPDVIVCLGDFADMASLSSYDRGTKAFEGRRYKADIESAKDAMATMLRPLRKYQKKTVEGHRERYNPRMVFTLGNHSYRIIRAINDDPKLDGTIGIRDLGFHTDWEVHDFLKPVIIDNIAYAHYFVTGVAGRPAGTAAAQLRKTNMSCVAGHQQGRQVAYASRADGSTITSIIAGSFYEHDEDYLGPQGNKHWRGLVVLNEVNNGSSDEMFVSLDYLKKRYL